MPEINKPNITYLLGAGASAYAVPTIKYFNFLLEHFKQEIEQRAVGYSGLETYSNRKLKSRLKLIENISSFATIDTWARKLYLSDSDEYHDLKLIISLFLAYCQMGSDHSIEYLFNDKDLITKYDMYLDDIQKSQFNQMFKRSIDPRYDLFLGTILKKTTNSIGLCLPNNINIISWNYDSQIEAALSTFSRSEINREDASKFKPIKLNGEANFLMKSGTNIDYPAFNFKSSKIDIDEFWHTTLGIVKDEFSDYRGISNQLKFAWEMDNNIINETNNIALSTEILVVIGYSFPSFNQEVERKIFSNANKIKKVYYQIPKQEYNEGLLERLKGTIFSGKERPQYNKIISTGNFKVTDVEFINIEDLKQFYIPNEFYI